MTLRANELRIANFVGATLAGNQKPESLSEFEMKVFLNHGFVIHRIESGVDLDNAHWYFPIPLTEEWLLKFGFENWGTESLNDYEQKTTYAKFNSIDGTSTFKCVRIKSWYGNTDVFEWVLEIDHNRVHINRLAFIHDVQNAFYLFAGYELFLANHPL